MSNKELEPIAKQVSLLNRLIELLMMQEDSFWVLSAGYQDEKDWSDELVKVARMLNKTEDRDKQFGNLKNICKALRVLTCDYGSRMEDKDLLELILNKHGRSLAE